MERREVLEELHLALEGAVEQMTRAQRLLTTIKDSGTPEDAPTLSPQLDEVFGSVVALRNEVRQRLMKELARGPRRLPVI